eukprot:CAMPEP_0184859320 /NCGR_PEP_ID=MMETSP0580-20130426/4321_1 /TAXON_ID=1118495 /ORGANISM="Dactyliosolen fragilissimus" /LENGTH=323 /DNA_ID=CAMNT_0027355877 /DNA_START=43 /DNA_END=1014 /DNA_ORIENTATION=-
MNGPFVFLTTFVLLSLTFIRFFKVNPEEQIQSHVLKESAFSQYRNLLGIRLLDPHTVEYKNPPPPTSRTNPDQKVAATDIAWVKRPKQDDNAIIAVINTPKTGTGGLTVYAARNTEHAAVFRTHKFTEGFSWLASHIMETQPQQCLVVTSIREPNTWMKSFFMQRYFRSICYDEEDYDMDKYLDLYRSWLKSNREQLPRAMNECLRGVLDEFGAPDLDFHFRNFDKNGGYSLVEHPEDGGIFQGCWLLFLRMEDAPLWPEVFTAVMPNEVKPYEPPVQTLVSLCPKLADLYTQFQTYNLSEEEKDFAIGTDPFMREYFRLYGV